MYPLNLDSLSIQRMASGHLCLNLSQSVNWDSFSNFAEAFIKIVEGEVLCRNDGVDIKQWNVLIDGQTLRLVFDDFPLMTSLESSDAPGDRVIEQVYDKLRSDR
jgi:hypothetical protein